jgi:tyrosine-protein kinase Etk/Wzc
MTPYTQQKNKHADTPEAGINIRQILQNARKYWYIFLILPVLTLGLAWLYAQYQSPVYEVKSTIMFKDKNNSQGVSATDLIAKELELGGDKKILVDESKIMTSHTVIEQVVRELKLDRQVMLKGRFKKEEIYGAACPIVIENFTLTDTVKGFEAPLSIVDDNTYYLTTPDGNKQAGIFGTTMNNAFGSFLIKKSANPKATTDKDLIIACNGVEKTARGIIKSIDIVLPKKESNMVEPTMLTTNPEKAKDILHTMITVYNRDNVSDKREVSQNTLAFVEKRLQALTSELSGVEQNVEAYKTREGMTAESQTDIAFFFSRLGDYDKELVKMEVQNSLLTSIEGVLTKQDANFDLLPTNLELKSSSLQNQIDDYNKMVLERNRLAKVAGDNNPTLKNLTGDINNMKRAIIGNIGRVKQENAAMLTSSEQKNRQYANKLSKTPRNERELTDIKRQQNIKEGLYLFLLQKQEETTISLAGAISDARVIDRPIISETPVGLKKSFLYILALGAGLFLSLAFVILSGLIVKTVQTEKEIEAKSTMPIVGKIPHSKNENNWAMQDQSNTVISEMFRSLRSNLQFYLPSTNGIAKKRGQMLLVTSATSGEGKDFITLNLGMSLAIANKKTVVVNFDLRKPNLSDNFQFLNKKMGITQYVATTDMYPHEVVQHSGVQKNLFYIHHGNIPLNPAELLMDNKITMLLNYLKDNFDYVLINTPPVGLVSDALVLKPFVDMTLFVVRSGYTKKAELSTVQEFSDGQKLPNPVIVFNDVKVSSKIKHYYFSEVSQAQDVVSSKKFGRGWLKENFS